MLGRCHPLAVPATTVLVLLATACTGDGGSPQAARQSPDAPAPISAGPLTQADLPAPADLGESWLPNMQQEEPAHQDPLAGSGEQAWLSEREPAELVAGLVPLGCPELGSIPQYPMPSHALQGRYVTPTGSNAVGLRLDYPGEIPATQLVAALAADARACAGPAGPPGQDSPYRRRYTVSGSGTDGFQVSWTESGAGSTDSTWHLLGLRSGSAVGLMYVEEKPGNPVELPDPAMLLP